MPGWLKLRQAYMQNTCIVKNGWMYSSDDTHAIMTIYMQVTLFLYFKRILHLWIKLPPSNIFNINNTHQTLNHSLSLSILVSVFTSCHHPPPSPPGTFQEAPGSAVLGYPEVKTLINILPAQPGEDKKALYLSGVLCSRNGGGERRRHVTLHVYMCRK